MWYYTKSSFLIKWKQNYMCQYKMFNKKWIKLIFSTFVLFHFILNKMIQFKSDEWNTVSLKILTNNVSVCEAIVRIHNDDLNQISSDGSRSQSRAVCVYEVSVVCGSRCTWIVDCFLTIQRESFDTTTTFELWMHL